MNAGDPLDELTNDIASLRDEVAAHHRTVVKELADIKSALGDILRALEEKDDE